jgi:adenylate cyclase
MLDAARQLVSAIREDDEALPVGVGLNCGVCEVGSIAKGESRDVTAVGDLVNTVARLQGCAKEYQIVLSESVFAAAVGQAGDAETASFDLKGKADAVIAHEISSSV